MHGALRLGGTSASQSVVHSTTAPELAARVFSLFLSVFPTLYLFTCSALPTETVRGTHTLRMHCRRPIARALRSVGRERRCCSVGLGAGNAAAGVVVWLTIRAQRAGPLFAVTLRPPESGQIILSAAHSPLRIVYWLHFARSGGALCAHYSALPPSASGFTHLEPRCTLRSRAVFSIRDFVFPLFLSLILFPCRFSIRCCRRPPPLI